MPKPKTYTFKVTAIVNQSLQSLKDKNELRHGIAHAACYPVEHPTSQGYEVPAEPIVYPTDRPDTFDVETSVRITDESLLVESAICHRLMRGLETEEPYEAADALFDLMIALGAGPLPEEMGMSFTLVGLERRN